MLTGEVLGRAIKQAIELKGVTKVAVARRFGIKPPSVQDWVKTGRISKPNLQDLMEWCSDVVGPDHWGLPELPATGSAPARAEGADKLIEELIIVVSGLSKAARHRVLATAYEEAEKATKEAGKDANENKTGRKAKGGR